MRKAHCSEQAPEDMGYREATFLHEGLSCCKLCGALVSSKELEEHLLGDELMLRIIHHNHPQWTPEECRDYYISTYRPGTPMHLKVKKPRGRRREGTTG